MFQNVIDGDLCEMFNSLDINKQKAIAEELDRTPSEVNCMLTEYCNLYLITTCSVPLYQLRSTFCLKIKF